jgi:hypothetical protein
MLERTTKNFRKLVLPDRMASQLLLGFNLLCEILLQLCKANNIQSLKYVSAMGWVAEDDDLACSCFSKQLGTVMRDVTV